MAELYTAPGPSGSQRSTSRDYPASQSPVYGVEIRASTPISHSSSSPERRIPHYFGTTLRPATTVSRSSSSPERRIPHYFGIDYRPTYPDHLHGETRSSARDQPHLDSQAATTSENRDFLEPNDYIRAWQGTLQTALPPNALPTNGVVPTGPPDLTDGRPQTRQ